MTRIRQVPTSAYSGLADVVQPGRFSHERGEGERNRSRPRGLSFPCMTDRGPTMQSQRPGETRVRLERVLALLEAHGLKVQPGSRAARFIRLLQQFANGELGPGVVGSVPNDVNELLEANRDFAELATIVEHLLAAQPPAAKALLAKLKHVLGGARFPREDANALPRSTQFELYVAARCARAGLAPKLREPDCVVTIGKVRLGIAAKRVAGSDVPGLVKQGASQLRKAKLDGLVSLSLDRLFAPNDERLVADTPGDLKPAAWDIALDTVRPYFDALHRSASGSRALAVLAFVVVPAAIPSTNSIVRIESVFLHVLRRITHAQAAALLDINERLGQHSGI